MYRQGVDFQHKIKTEIDEGFISLVKEESPGSNTTRNSRESQDEVKFSLKTYVKSEPISSEIEAGEPLNLLQNREFNEDTFKEESFVDPEFLSQEDVDIKPEDEENGQSSTKLLKGDAEHRSSNKTDSLNSTSSDPIERPVFKCFNCSYSTHRKQNISDHVRKHMKIAFKCPQCPYETWNRGYLRKHKVVHASEEDVEIHKCLECPYTTKWKSSITRHVLVHKSSQEMDGMGCQKEKKFQCLECPYKTWNKRYLTKHQSVHASKEQLELYKCPECPFTTTRKGGISNHLLVHQDLTEVTWYQCPECPYKTKRKTNLLFQHMLIHRKDEPIQKCTLCPYQCRRKYTLKLHLKYKHKSKDMGDPEEKMFKCSKCPYESKHKKCVIGHELKHESADNWYSCSLCPYKTPYKDGIKKHALIHKSDSEVEWYSCLECPFKTKHKGNFKTHKLHQHKHPITNMTLVRTMPLEKRAMYNNLG